MLTMDSGPWVAQRVGAFWNEGCTSIGWEKDGRIVAGVLYESWNGRSIVCHIAIEGQMTPSYLATIFDYPFNQLVASKIIAPIAEKNVESVRFVEKLGFRKEAQILDAHPDGSLLIYTMTRQMCRFIKDKYYGKRYRSTAES